MFAESHLERNSTSDPAITCSKLTIEAPERRH